jgi:hypothetical protein
MSMENADRAGAENKHVVVLMHGIRDFAEWQSVIRHALESAGFTVEPTNYMRLDVVRFLVPVGFFRNQVIQKIWGQIEDIRVIHPGAPISFIAHSFGTYILAEILRRQFSFRAHRVILCGSVVRFDFPFEQIKDRFISPIVNEVGTRDVWPAMAESCTSGYGSAGTYGFRRPRVRDRWHNGKTHSAFLTSEFCQRFWVPFLQSGKIVEGDIPPERPVWWIRLLSVFRIKYLVLLLLAIAAGLAIFRSSPAEGTWGIKVLCGPLIEQDAHFSRGKHQSDFVWRRDGAKGQLEMEMTTTAFTVSLTGKMHHGKDEVYDVSAHGMGWRSFAGTGRIGGDFECPFTAIRR